MMASDGQEIIIQAAPFCYGPASIGIAIANEIRKQDRTGSTRLIAMGEQTSYDLFSTSGLFDQCEQIDCDCPDSWSTPVIRKLKGASKIVSVVDPDFSKAINTVGRRAIYVDPLYWMWDKNPISVLSCEKYFALNFPGVAERISRIHEGEPEERRPTIVDAVRDNVTLEALKTETTDDSLLITYGGMQSPLGSNIRLALVMTRIIAEVALEGELYGNVFIRGGGHPIRMITKHLAINNERIVVDPFPSHPSEFLSLLANCQSLVTVPGMSIVYEALFFKKNTLFGLPLNYSQHLQTQAYLKMLSNAYFIRWDDIEGYESLPAGLSEEEGVQRAIEMGNRFSNDNHAQRMFREKVAVFLHSQSKPGIGISENSDMKFKGAEVVAKFLLNEYSPDIR